MVTMEMMDIHSVPLEPDNPTVQHLLRVMSLVVVSTLSIIPASTPRTDIAWVWRIIIFNDSITSVNLMLPVCFKSETLLVLGAVFEHLFQ